MIKFISTVAIAAFALIGVAAAQNDGPDIFWACTAPQGILVANQDDDLTYELLSAQGMQGYGTDIPACTGPQLNLARMVEMLTHQSGELDGPLKQTKFAFKDTDY